MVTTAAGADVAKPRRPKVIVIAIAAAVVLALVAVAALVLPRLLGGQAADGADVVDVTSTPRTSWSYNWVGENDPELLLPWPEVTAIGNDRALVWAAFDYEAYLDSTGGSSEWYEGYDEQYADGYAAGVQYSEDAAAYEADTYPYTIPRPDEEDYFPEGAYDNYDDFLGFQDGYYDGREGETLGANQKEPPPTPQFTPEISAIDVNSGSVAWTVNLADVVETIDYTSYYYATEIPGSSAVVVTASTYRPGDSSYSVIALDKGTGAVISSLTTDGSLSAVPFEGDLVVSVSDAAGETSRVARYSPDRLDGDPRWSVDRDEQSYISIVGDFVLVRGDDSGTVLDASNGKSAGWGDDVDGSTGYTMAGSQLLRVTGSDDGSGDSDSYSLEGWSTDGTATWKAPIEVAYLEVVESVLFTVDSGDDSYSGLQRVDATTGTGLWKEPFDGDFEAILGLQGGAVLLQSDSGVVVLDLATGEERYSVATGEFDFVYEGSALYYVPSADALTAFRYDSDDEVWSLDLDGTQLATTIGNRLGLADSAEGTLSALVAG